MKTEATETRNAETVTISRAEYEELKTEYEALKEDYAELTRKLEWLMEQLRLSRQKRFGASSEKTNEDGFEQLSLLFNEAEVYAEAEVGQCEGHSAGKHPG